MAFIDQGGNETYDEFNDTGTFMPTLIFEHELLPDVLRIHHATRVFLPFGELDDGENDQGEDPFDWGFALELSASVSLPGYEWIALRPELGVAM